MKSGSQSKSWLVKRMWNNIGEQMQIGSPGIIGNNIITIGGSGPGIQIYRPRQKGITIPFYTTQAVTDVKITVTGTPDILWTWADGTTSTTADPGSHDMSGTDGHCSLYVSDPLAITRFETNAWKPACNFRLNLNSLRKCKNLSRLCLYVTNCEGNISNLSNMIKLERIYLYKTDCEGDISALSNMIELDHLYLADTNCEGNISNLSNMTELHHLYLVNTNCGGNISNLVDLLELQYLHLANTNCEGCLSNLSNMTGLERIYFYDTNISKTDMSNMVAQMYSIRTTLGGNSCSINISNCNGITTDAIAMIEGTGAYAGDGLKDAGCTVVY